MSRREGRDSDSRHHRSKFDREPSPKRPRRDGKPATERPATNLNLDTAEHSDRDQKHRRRLQDALPLEAPAAPDPKVETKPLSKEYDKKTNGHSEGTKHSSDPAEATRSRSFFQHDERGNAGQAGRSFSRRETTDRGWWKDSKERVSERATNRAANNDVHPRDEKPHARLDDNRAWRHDGYFKMEADPKPPAKKRPSFREKKIPVDAAGSVDKEATEQTRPSHAEHSATGSERREEREKPLADRHEKRFSGERDQNKSESQRVNFSSRDGYGGGGSYRGRERFNGRQGHHQNGAHVDKWKHDLFDDANRSPTPKNEEDQIAKVEALLSS